MLVLMPLKRREGEAQEMKPVRNNRAKFSTILGTMWREWWGVSGACASLLHSLTSDSTPYVLSAHNVTHTSRSTLAPAPSNSLRSAPSFYAEYARSTYTLFLKSRPLRTQRPPGARPNSKWNRRILSICLNYIYSIVSQLPSFSPTTSWLTSFTLIRL